MKKIIAGITFAALWASGSLALKIGLEAAQPLVLINCRFLIAAFLMLAITMLIYKPIMPLKKEWLPLIICGLLNMTIYSSLFIYAMKFITPGIGTLGAAISPLIISFLNAIWLKQKITLNIWLGLLLGLFGVTIALYPLLKNAHASFLGIALLGISMVCYAIGTVYYQSIKWTLPRLNINAWQVLFGGLFLAPFTIYFYVPIENSVNNKFIFSVLWMTIPISIIAVQIWLYLLKAEPTKASLWLFLCPVFGFIFSNFYTNEPITIYTITGTIIVIIGLYLGQKKTIKKISA